MASDLDDILEHATRWHRGGLGVAFATVVQTWGSSPRPAGSKLVVNERSEHAGSVSGGCIEGAVIEEALATMRGAAPKLLSFGITDDKAWEVGLACGGKVEVWVAAMDPAIVEELRAARAAKRAVALITP